MQITGLTLKHKLESQRGASIVEFVIVTPLIMLVAMLAWQVNHHAELEQAAIIASRNAAYLGAANVEPALADTILSQIVPETEKAMAGFVEDQERAQLRTVLNDQNSATAGFAVSTTDEASQRTDSDERTKTIPNLNLDQSGTGSSIYSGLDRVGEIGSKALTNIGPMLGSTMGLAGMDAGIYRKALVETRITQSETVLAKTIGGLSKLTNKTTGISLDLGQASSAYAPSVSGYHTNSYTNHMLLSATIGFTKASWNGSGDAGHNVQQWPNRCMIRLTHDDKCESTNTRSMDRGFGQSLATVMTSLGALKTMGEAATLGIATVIQGVFANVAEGYLKNKVKELIDDAVTAATKKITDDLNRKVETLREDLSTTITSEVSVLTDELNQNQNKLDHIFSQQGAL